MKLLPILAITAFVTLAFCMPVTPALSHSGGLNSEGCHHIRKTGDYHCHRGGSGSTQAKARTYGVLGRGGAFRNCTAARAAGAAPVRRGDPGYGSHLDRDNDGVGCE